MALVPRRVKAPSPRLIDNHYRVSLTKEVRRTLGIGPGDYVTFTIDPDGTVRLHKLALSIAPVPAPFGPRQTPPQLGPGWANAAPGTHS